MGDWLRSEVLGSRLLGGTKSFTFLLEIVESLSKKTPHPLVVLLVIFRPCVPTPRQINLIELYYHIGLYPCVGNYDNNNSSCTYRVTPNYSLI